MWTLNDAPPMGDKLQKNNALIYFDCFAAIGRRAGKDPEAPWTTDALLAEMARCRVHAALVFAHQAREIHPEVGNPLVSEVCASQPRLYPCWVGMPHHTGEMAPPEQLVADMEAHGVRALKLYPRTYRHAVDAPTLGALLSLLQEAGLLLVVDRGEYGEASQIDWTEIAWICQTFPRLPLLLHNVRWEATRRLLPLSREFENLYFEFSNYQGNRMLEFWCREIGHERLLFGSDALEKSIGAARAYIDYADLTSEQRQAIAGGNLMRLLRVEQPPPPYPDREPADRFVAAALAGEPIQGELIIDAHAHIVQKGGRGATRVAMNKADAEGVVERNRKLGVQKTCISAWTAIWGDYRLGNEDTIHAMQHFPNEIIGYAALDPNYVTDWQAEFDYYYRQHRFSGMKPYFPRMGLPYNDPLFEPWWEFGNAHRLIALMHPSDNFISEMEDLASRFPQVQFLLAHSGWSWKVARQHIDLARRFSNCFLEITFTSVIAGIIEFIVREVGAERVIYGSDAPMRDPAPQFGWVAYAGISESEKRLVFGQNMAKILSRITLPAEKRGQPPPR